MNPARDRSPRGGRSRVIGGAASNNGVKIPDGLPPHARQVYNGVVLDVWRWEQEMFNGSTEVYERAWRADTVTVIPIVGNSILIQHQEQPLRGAFISLPGGVCESDNPEEDARRELLEETGYAGKTWIPLMTWSTPDSKMVWSNHYYIAKECTKIQEVAPDPGEKISLDIVSFDAFLALADDPTWRHQDLVPTMLRARYERAKYAELHRVLFGDILTPNP